MNTFTAILAFAAVCTIPACLAVPCLGPAPITAATAPMWTPGCLSPCTNLGALLASPSIANVATVASPSVEPGNISGCGGVTLGAPIVSVGHAPAIAVASPGCGGSIGLGSNIGLGHASAAIAPYHPKCGGVTVETVYTTPKAIVGC